ncbi:exonuclease domain-containing protein [Cysteiniphilum sp. 6C5]|uniref:exonuclease domain-containing protein n=1 Tax=unclassified Cysteiniphilum TaxID=2610889 RepID=UPI003F84B94E
MAKTFLFYDLETTGINKCFDQIIQFAAVRTDEALNEIERYEFLIKLNPDTIPNPEASITHHISIEQANTGLFEYEAIKKIYALFNTPETVSLGYNTLSFDDEFLRFAFFKNLFPAYDHQYKNNCSRMDLYPMVASFYLFANDVLSWPINDENKVSLKLEDINAQNGLHSEGRAHDALTDVLVTLALARKLKSHQPKMWDYLTARFNKTEDQKVLSQLDIGLQINGEDYQQALMISGRFGYNERFMLPVLNLGQHWHYKNQWCFLRLDYAELTEVSIDNLSEHFLTVNKKWGDLPIVLPAKKRFLAHLSAERIALIKRNKAFLMQNPSLFIDIKESALDFKYPEVENIDVDASLYTAGFMNYAEQALCEHFHQKGVVDKVKLMREMNRGLYERALRVIGRMEPDILTTEMQGEFQAYLEKIASFETENMPVDFKGGRKVSIPEVYERIQKLRESELTEEQLYLLDELEAYLSL